VPQGSIREILNDDNIFDILTNDMIYFEQEYGNDCKFIMCGDKNARVGI